MNNKLPAYLARLRRARICFREIYSRAHAKVSLTVTCTTIRLYYTDYIAHISDVILLLRAMRKTIFAILTKFIPMRIIILTERANCMRSPDTFI